MNKGPPPGGLSAILVPGSHPLRLGTPCAPGERGKGDQGGKGKPRAQGRAGGLRRAARVRR